MSTLTLTFLGVGSAFAKRNHQSNALIEAWDLDASSQEVPNDTLLIDFGTTGPIALHELKQRDGFAYLDRNGQINYPAVKNIIVTHQHADHVGGLEELAGINRHVFGKSGVGACPRLISTGGVLDDLWAHSLSGGLTGLSGRNAVLEDYFRPFALEPFEQGQPDRIVLLNRFEFALVPTDHVRIHEPFDWPSYAVWIVDRQTGDAVLYSGDTRFDRVLVKEYMERAGLIFHDVQLDDDDDAVHATLSELRTLSEAVRRRMLLYHYGDTWDGADYAHVPEEFAGFARPHERYVLFS